MKKKILFLLTIISLFVCCKDVKAENIQFYEAEKLTGIYTKSVNGNGAHFQKARFFRRKSDNKEAYCIEPFAFFDENSNYSPNTTPTNISNETWKKMSLIAYYGYNYNNHTDKTWYAVTQLLLWQEVDKQADFYFTDTLNGQRIEKFQDEINEIKQLVNNHEKLPSFYNKVLNIKKGTKYIYDENNAIENFYNIENTIAINQNKLDISSLDEGSYTFTFERNISDNGEPVFFYYNDTSQNLMTRGNISKDKFTVKINIYDTQLQINKIDQDTKTNTSKSNKAKLCDAKLALYDQNKNLVKELILGNNCNVTLNNLDLGTYYIKEIEAGYGYMIDEDFHEIVLSLEKPKTTLEIANKVIEKEISIHKDYGNNNTDKKPEDNVIFDIYSQDKFIDSITTNQYGDAKIVLPYGEYVFKQITSKDGYNLVEDFNVTINEEDNKINYELMDYIIKVPNTRSDNNSYYFDFIILLILGFYVTKKITN